METEANFLAPMGKFKTALATQRYVGAHGRNPSKLPTLPRTRDYNVVRLQKPNEV
jgi:hypothetical protein